MHWDRLLFSAKEAIYKAWYPLTGRWLGFEDASLLFDPSSGTFEGRILIDSRWTSYAAAGLSSTVSWWPPWWSREWLLTKRYGAGLASSPYGMACDECGQRWSPY